MFNLTSAIRKERFHMTVRELAKQIGVSPATISIVLNGKRESVRIHERRCWMR